MKKYQVFVENMNKTNPVPKFVNEFDTENEALEFIKERKDQFVYAYDDSHEVEYRKKFNFFIKR